MVTTFYPPYNFGGDGVYVHRLSNELAARGHHVEVIHCIDTYRLTAPEPADGYQDHPNVKVHGLRSGVGALSPLATHQTGRPWFKSKRIQEILDQNFDVVHFHNISSIGGPKILEYGRGVKLCTLHDFWMVCPTHALFRFNRKPCPEPTQCVRCSLSYKRPPQLWRGSSLLKDSARHIDAFIAPSTTSRRKHLEMGFEGRIELLPNFVPVADGGRADFADQPSPRRPYFLFVGRLEKLKGLDTIISAFRKYRNAQLWIAGTGSEEAALRELSGGSENIRFLGHQSGDALGKLYREAVALLYPSVNFQTGGSNAPVARLSAPLVLMEAFSTQTPVIVSNVGRIPKLIEDTGSGLAYSTERELLAALDELTTRPAKRRELGTNGYRVYQANWTPEVHLERYLALVAEIAGEPPVPLRKLPTRERAVRPRELQAG